MKHVSALAFVLALGVGTSWAAEPAAPAKEMPKKEAKAAKAAAAKFAGTAESVDAAAGKLTVKDKAGKAMTFTLGADAKVMKGGKKAALADIMAGDSLAVTYEGMADAPVIKSVKVMKGAKAKAGKK